jgi:hypothetical protein
MPTSEQRDEEPPGRASNASFPFGRTRFNAGLAGLQSAVRRIGERRALGAVVLSNLIAPEGPRMEKRKTGEHAAMMSRRLRSAATCSVGTVDEPTSFLLLDTFRRRRVQPDRHCGLVFALGARGTGGESETIIGRWIAKRGRHDDVVIATKIGSDMGWATSACAASTSCRASSSR